MRKTWVLGVMLSALLLSACSAKPQELIVGKWETTDALGKVQYAEFSKNGTASVPLFLGLRADCKYKFLDDNNIEVELGNKVHKAKVAVTKETLTVTMESGETKIFKRVQ